MKNFSTAVITRFHYPKNHPDFEWRLNYYKKEVLPRLLAQTDQDFDIYIWCEHHHGKLFRSIHPRIKTFSATYEKRNSKRFLDFTNYNNTVGLPKHIIQIGLDSDDLVEQNFIEKVHSICKGDKSLFVSFQPVKKDIKTGKVYRMDNYKSRGYGSPIYAIYQPKDFIFCYHTGHLEALPGKMDKVLYVDEGFAMMSIHDLNDSTKIKPRDICI